jgi:hypothetical protein
VGDGPLVHHTEGELHTNHTPPASRCPTLAGRLLASLRIDRDFLYEFGRPEKSIQDGVYKASPKFEHGTHAGTHLEKIKNVRYPRLKSFRVGLQKRRFYQHYRDWIIVGGGIGVGRRHGGLGLMSVAPG